jgi:hypothetical protein
MEDLYIASVLEGMTPGEERSWDPHMASVSLPGPRGFNLLFLAPLTTWRRESSSPEVAGRALPMSRGVTLG